MTALPAWLAWPGLAAGVALAWWVWRVAGRRRIDGLRRRGLRLLDEKRFDEALLCFERMLAHRPDDPQAQFQRGLALLSLSRHDAAIECFDLVLGIDPEHAQAHYRRGNACLKLQRYAEALASYDRAVARQPALADAHYNRGLALQALKRGKEAVASYDRALALQPDDAEALNNRGNALLEMHRPQGALDSYRRALQRRPDMVDAHFNCGVAWQELKRPDEAAAAYHRVRELQPDHPEALGRLLHARMQYCDWRDFDVLRSTLDRQVRQGSATADPFGYLASAGSSADLLRAAARYAQAFRVPDTARLWTGARPRHDRIRLGYLSGDFRHQATSILMVELFERHDKRRFELTAFDAGWSDNSPIRRRIEAAFDAIVDISQLSDEQAAAEMHRREIDIIVDLNGYFGLARPGVLARRPCPIQVNYLGFPGTLGAAHMDYILADACVIPEDDRANFIERVVWLPDCYQANDSQRIVPVTTGTRAEAGLPERGFVFCCFNNNFKITPEVFAVWMHLLKRDDISVLWLLEDNAAAAANLRRAALQQGVAPQRLVFAPRLPLDAHLARHGLADLFLDTLPCNAHTTASDALWAGLPLLTCKGHTFPGRVAASLLGALDLPELVTHSLAEYEERAAELARSPALMQALKAKLARHRLVKPLFDSTRQCRHIEAAYLAMWQRWQHGEAPAAIVVPAFDSAGPVEGDPAASHGPAA